MGEYRVFEMDDTEAVATFLKSGGVLAYPSESVWGLGCDAYHQQAIERIFRLKVRSEHKGLIVLTDGVEKLSPLLAELPQKMQDMLMTDIRQRYNSFDVRTATQAQTWLMPVATSAGLPCVLTGGFDTLAVRVTHHPVLAGICQALTDVNNPYGFLVSTSCNLSGQPSATTLQEAMAYFGHQVGYLNTKSLGFGSPSQIVDIKTGKILR
ncbi:L-threonylcarbamoyladenylate synthase [Moraxella sp. ZY200743]|uniref:L-threonylcarbamoyladenylate synthase n=1 Tax=Moraxella sp. ZY200743 TaxID=2911970 RepID=UPI003D7F1627